MARPKPPVPTTNRCVRLTDDQFAKFRQLGGVAWLRKYLDGLEEKPTVKQASILTHWINGSPFH